VCSPIVKTGGHGIDEFADLHKRDEFKALNVVCRFAVLRAGMPIKGDF
jgi:hypothetical protein